MKQTSSKKPIRLFTSDFLEFFSHIHPAVVLVVYLPILGYFIALSVRHSLGSAVPAYYIPIGFIIGLGAWTLTEYLLHRFVFHFKPRGSFAGEGLLSLSRRAPRPADVQNPAGNAPCGEHSLGHCFLPPLLRGGRRAFWCPLLGVSSLLGVRYGLPILRHAPLLYAPLSH